MNLPPALAPYQRLLDAPSSWRDARKCVVTDSIGTVSTSRPITPPSRWSRLLGRTWIYQTLLGGPTERKNRRDTQSAERTQFFHALDQAYGHRIGKQVRQAIWLPSHCLPLASVRAAVTQAHTLATASEATTTSNHAAFEAALTSKLTELEASSFESPNPKTPMARAIREQLMQSPRVRQLLAQITLGRTLTHARASAVQIADAVDQASNLISALSRAQAMTLERALEVLRFASMNNEPVTSQALVCDLAVRGSNRHLLNSSGVVPHDFIGKHVPPSFVSTHDLAFGQESKASYTSSISKGGIAFARTVEDEGMTPCSDPQGNPFALHNVMLKDSNRSTFVINGKALPKNKDEFPHEFRARLPQGQEGHQLAALISVCLNQNNLTTLSDQVRHAAFLPLGDGSPDSTTVLHEAHQLPDGDWALRSTSRKGFQKIMKPEGETHDLPAPCMALYTIDYRVHCGSGSVQAPRVTNIRTDVVFTSGSSTGLPQAIS